VAVTLLSDGECDVNAQVHKGEEDLGPAENQVGPPGAVLQVTHRISNFGSSSTSQACAYVVVCKVGQYPSPQSASAPSARRGRPNTGVARIRSVKPCGSVHEVLSQYYRLLDSLEVG